MFYSLTFGLFLPLLPLVGSGVLLAFAVVFLIAQRLQGRRCEIVWAAPFLSILCAWTLAECVWSFDLPTIRMLWNGDDGPGAEGGRNILASLYYAPPLWLLQIGTLLRFAVLAALVSFFLRQERERDSFCKGLEYGLVAAAALSGFLIFCPWSWTAPNQTAFWTSLNRASGTFSDPNAFGIFVILILPILMWRAKEGADSQKWWRYSLAAIWLLLGLYSGSRSFFLGLGVYGVWWLFLRGWRALMAAAFAVCACILVLNLIGGSANSLAALPEGLRRIHESMLISNLSATFFSRTAFWEIGWNIWLDNLLFGAGFERFRMLTSEYASQLGLGLGTWVDNSNNFYLGVLAELGIIGAASLALSLRPLTFKIGEYDSLLRAPVAAFLFLLLFGPHLSFDEVAVLFALILGLNCSINLPQFGIAKSVAALAVVALIALKASQLPRGIYAWEKEGELSVRWTARSAQMLFRCSREGLAHLRVRALNPDADANPVTGNVTSSLGEIKGFQLRTNEWASLNLACPVLQSAALDSISMPISIEVSRIWTPRKFGLGADRRRLGVQIAAP